MNNSAIFITFDGLSDPLGQSQILPYVNGLAVQGYRMQIISCEKKKRIAGEEQNIRSQLAVNGIGWNFLVYDESGGMLSRLLYIRTLRRLCEKSVKKEKPALIHCRSYLAALIGLHFKRHHNIAFVFDMRGLWADERVDGNIWKMSNPLHAMMYHFFKRKENAFVSDADAIISLTHKGKGELNRLYPEIAISQKTTIIPCCTDTLLFDPAKVRAAQLVGLRPDAYLLVYSGSIGTWYCSSEMIDCICEWRKKIPSLQLLILTRDQQELKSILQKPGIPKDLVLTASCSRQDVPSYLKLAKAAIFFIKPVYSKLASSPTKMAECWSMDLPLISNAGIGDNDELFERNKGGILVQSFDHQSYVKALELYLHTVQNKGHYRNIAVTEFSLAIAIERYSLVYKSVIDNIY